MSFTSYAQNFEDVMLWRALKHVHGGFYIDVGAQDPVTDSVSLGFYEHGWRGVHVEPTSQYSDKLKKARPDETVLQVAVGKAIGPMTLYEFKDTGLSTADPAIARQHLENGFECTETQVPVLTLDELLDQNGARPVHWLKIDVEGLEHSVLESWERSEVRPWILVIESTLPLSQVPSHDNWEPLVLAKGYEFVYFDGLNRFYVSQDHLDLRGAFGHPPTVFDDFVLSGLSSQPFHRKLVQDIASAHSETAKRQAVIDAMLRSRSWRMTAPVRWVGEQVRRLKVQPRLAGRGEASEVVVVQGAGDRLRLLAAGGVDMGDLKTAARQLVGRAAAQADRFPRFKRAAVGIIRRLPGVEYRLRAALTAHRTHRATEPVVIASLADREQRAPLQEDQIALPLPRGSRIVYIYVEHTANCPTNTGVQRVTRSLAKGLRAHGERVRFVKWHPASQRCLLINATEREHLALWNGPPVLDEERGLYPAADQPQTPVADSMAGENHWLVVPEVTHITFHPQPVTLDLLLWSRRAGLKSAFVFYDAIPLRRPELAEAAPRHALYMQQLLLADVVWPISDWAKADLEAFWREHERADDGTLPELQTLRLSGESPLCARVTQAQGGSEPLILSIGSIEPRKNQVQLIRAFQAYRAKNPGTPWRLALVGNLHPSVADEVRAAARDGTIQHLGNVPDEELDALYRRCAFTVFPSVEEGFGLPILESLWYGKPCICADFGSMAEVARDGGCLMLDTRSQHALAEGIARLIGDESLRSGLVAEALRRPITTWSEYAGAVSARIEAEGHPAGRLGIVYCWIGGTLGFSKNTGIQRVTRQLARSLIEQGVRVVPVKWGGTERPFAPVTREELAFFSSWNGPSPDAWQPWIEPARAGQRAWFLMPELPLDRPASERAQLLRTARDAGLRCAAIFYDAIPWKMRRIYPPMFAQEHRAYMTELSGYDLVLPISAFSREDLVDFLGAALPRPQSLSDHITAVPLAGEFAESERAMQGPVAHTGPLRLLCVGTVEPRKNHLTLLHAFELASRRSDVPLQLTLAGGSHNIEPGLADRVRAFVAVHPDVTWEENADDARLRELHLQSDFTVYPSVEEGFGLPILESLWYARPCICADFGAMLEVAEGGGCLTVDVRDAEVLANAIERLASDSGLRARLAQEASSRRFKSWSEYAAEVALRLVQATPAAPASSVQLAPQEIAARAQAMHLQPRPKLSVCISTYNRAEWLSASLRNWSRLYPEPLEGVELLVCDNTSTDHTPQVVTSYLARRDFSYHRNAQNVGMLGNLRETAHHARGEYVWIVGDDDLLLPGSVERVLDALMRNPGIALVYLNYAFTREEDARKIKDFDAFFAEAQPIVPPEADRQGPIRSICARNENFFTAIYTLVFRRDHAIKAYSQDTSGRPFSSMPTCIPTTTYVLGHMMEEPGLWIGTPQIVVNLNVSWMKYAPLWILERVPEVYEVAERHGVPAEDMDRWRRHTLPGVVHFFQDIYRNDPLGNAAYFSAERLVRRFKHLPEFTKALPVLKGAYERAHAAGHPAARRSPDKVFPDSGFA